MGRGGIASLCLAALLIGGVGGYFTGGGGAAREESPAATVPRDGGDAARILALEGRIAELYKEKGEREEALKALAARLEAPAEKEAEAKETEPAAAAPAAGIAVIELASTGEADGAFEDALRRYDVEGLLALGIALLSMGEEGYDKMISLIDRMASEMEKDRMLASVFGNEIIAGRFLRAVADHHEDILRCSLHVLGKDPETLGPVTKDLRRELAKGEIGGFLLGYYEGDDPEITSGFLDFYRGELERGDLRGDVVNAVAQIRGEEATDLLLDLLEKASANRLNHLINALWYRRDPRALEALRSLRARVDSPETGALIDVAIRTME